MTKGNSEDDYSPEEVERRRDAVLKIMVNTPPRPRSTQDRPKKKTTTALGRQKPPVRRKTERGA